MTAWILSSLLFGAPASADAAAAVPAKPPVRLLNRDLGGGLRVAIRIQPGVPEVGQVTRVIVEVSKKGPAGPVPLNGAASALGFDFATRNGLDHRSIPDHRRSCR